METRSLLRQIMGYSIHFGVLILLAVAANGADPATAHTATTHPPDKSSALSLPHPTVAANESSENASMLETIHMSRENGKNKTSAKVYSTPLEPPSKESTAAAKLPPIAIISSTKSSPGEKPRAKPGQAKGEREGTSTTTPAATCGSGGLTTSLGIIMAVVLSLLLCF